MVWIAPASPAATHNAATAKDAGSQALPGHLRRSRTTARRRKPAYPIPTGRAVLEAEAGSDSKANTSEGDVAHAAPTARSLYDVDGTGIGIGVLSNGIATLRDRQASGDLPSAIAVLAGQAGRGDEGTAMLEIVHDLAPGAHLYYATALGSPARFAANIEALCAAGADVIVDDIFYFHEGAFQDDIIARAVNAVVAQGCFYFSAAGNAGNRNDGTSGVWEGDFVAAGSAPSTIGAGVVHDFGGASSNRVTKAGLSFVLQWADPLGNASNDYDLYLFDETLTTVVRRSANVQSDEFEYSQPLESFFSSSSDVDKRLVVIKASGRGRFLRVDSLRGQLEKATSGQTVGHSAAKAAIGVAAVDVEDAGEDGVFDGTESVEEFSSDGPRRFFFEPDGAPITPGNFSASGGELALKPDIAAADGVSTATPGFGDFHGTSAAAPHAAAIAALMVQAVGGPRRITPSELQRTLAAVALDIEAPGADRDSGAGILMAPAAVAAVKSATDYSAPTVSNGVAEQLLTSYDSATVVNLSNAFAAAGALTYTALSSDTNVAEVEVAGSTLAIRPLIRGTAVVTVRATDANGLSVIATFEVTVDRIWGATDYDTDDDGLVEIANLEQLNAVRYDLDGDSFEDSVALAQDYFAAFPNAARDMGCPSSGCVGYELVADLDFEARSSYAAGAVNQSWIAGEGREGWPPIGGFGGIYISSYEEEIPAFSATFDGNGHSISNLFIDRGDTVGLFGGLTGTVRNIGLVDVTITGGSDVGGLAGIANDLPGLGIRNSFVTGSVSGQRLVGGLVGSSYAPIEASYSTASVQGFLGVGGLVGYAHSSAIVASYATGRVSGFFGIGGLVGSSAGSDVRSSYSTARVSGRINVGGLVGDWSTGNFGVIPIFNASYWDLDTAGVAVGVGSDDLNGNGVIDGDETTTVFGRATAQLVAPVDYSGIYGRWQEAPLRWDQPALLAPWHLGDSNQYPVLVGFSAETRKTWSRFGHQIRERLELTVAAVGGAMKLAWTQPDTSHWNPPPELGYAIYRNGELLAARIRGTAYTDRSPPVNAEYQVAATVDGGEPVRSNIAPVRRRPPPVSMAGIDYDDDDDGLIEISTIEQLNAIRYDLDGNGAVDVAPREVLPEQTLQVAYATAFPRAALNMGCDTGCSGYELTADLDFDTNGTGVPDVGDKYWNSGNGWQPVGMELVYALGFCARGFKAIFEGNGHAIRNVHIDRQDDRVGLFGTICRRNYAPNGVRNLRLLDVDVSGLHFAGALAANVGQSAIQRVAVTGNVSGENSVGGLAGRLSVGGSIRYSHFSGLVSGNFDVGGLVGRLVSGGSVRYSHFSGLVSGDLLVGGLVGLMTGPQATLVEGSHTAGSVTGSDVVGGIVGHNWGALVRTSWSRGTVSGTSNVGGLIGWNARGLTNDGHSEAIAEASYSAGSVSGQSQVGGLVGYNTVGSTIRTSYAAANVAGDEYAVGLLVGFNNGEVVHSYSERQELPSSAIDAIGAIGKGAPSGASNVAAEELQRPTDYTGIFRQWNLDLDGDGRPDAAWDFGTTRDYPALKADADGDGVATWLEFGLQRRRNISAQRLYSGNDVETLDLELVFGQRAGVVYEASSSNPAVAMATVSGSLLMIVPNEEGEATVTVVARMGDTSAVVRLTVEVVPSPRFLRGWRVVLGDAHFVRPQPR